MTNDVTKFYVKKIITV